MEQSNAQLLLQSLLRERNRDFRPDGTNRHALVQVLDGNLEVTQLSQAGPTNPMVLRHMHHGR